MTREEAQDRMLKARKNKEEKKKFGLALERCLQETYRMKILNSEGEEEVICGTGVELMAKNALMTAIDPTDKLKIKAMEMVRDTIGEKPTDKVDIDTSTFNIVVENKELENFFEEDKEKN